MGSIIRLYVLHYNGCLASCTVQRSVVGVMVKSYGLRLWSYDHMALYKCVYYYYYYKNRVARCTGMCTARAGHSSIVRTASTTKSASVSCTSPSRKSVGASTRPDSATAASNSTSSRRSWPVQYSNDVTLRWDRELEYSAETERSRERGTRLFSAVRSVVAATQHLADDSPWR